MAIVTVAVSLPNGVAESHPDEDEWKTITNQIQQVAGRVRDAIARRDVPGLLKFVGKSGLRCGDDLVSRRSVEEMLKNPGSWLYDELFDTEALRRQGREGAVSIRDFFLKAEGLEIDVGLHAFSGRKELDYPCVVFRARNSTETPGFCFFMEGKHWVLSDFSGC